LKIDLKFFVNPPMITLSSADIKIKLTGTGIIQL